MLFPWDMTRVLMQITEYCLIVYFGYFAAALTVYFSSSTQRVHRCTSTRRSERQNSTEEEKTSTRVEEDTQKRDRTYEMRCFSDRTRAYAAQLVANPSHDPSLAHTQSTSSRRSNLEFISFPLFLPHDERTLSEKRPRGASLAELFFVLFVCSFRGWFEAPVFLECRETRSRAEVIGNGSHAKSIHSRNRRQQ